MLSPQFLPILELKMNWEKLTLKDSKNASTGKYTLPKR